MISRALGRKSGTGESAETIGIELQIGLIFD